MNPIHFTCAASLPNSPAQIAQKILDVENWTDFTGYGPLPGIKCAEFEERTAEIVGSRIRVRNTDGSEHVEEIIEWQPENGTIRMELKNFPAPLSRLASGFEEAWSLSWDGTATAIERHFTLHPHSIATKLPLWLISRLLRKAVNRHLKKMEAA